MKATLFLSVLTVLAISWTTVVAKTDNFGSDNAAILEPHRIDQMVDDESDEIASVNQLICKRIGRHLVNNSKNCGAYYECILFIPFHRSCDEGLNFNEEEQRCDRPEDFECVDEDTTPSPPKRICRTINRHLVNNPANCRAYYECILLIPLRRRCDEGLNFNEEAQRCDKPEDFQCSDDETGHTPPATTTEQSEEPTETQPPETTLGPVDFECPDYGIEAYPVEGSCVQYHFCFGGAHLLSECAPDLHFDAVERKCAKPEIAKCFRDICPSIDDIENIVTIPDPEHCEKFSVCVGGEPWHFECSEGLYWHQAIQHCDYPHNVDCPAS